MIIKTWRDPYEAGFSPTRPTSIELNEGLTVLVGCNGAGKSTLLQNIKEVMNKQNIPCHLYNNLNEGGSSAFESAIYSGDMSLGVALFSSSEGESIKINIGKLSNLFDEFLETGFMATRKNRLSRALRDEEEHIDSNIRVLLFDAIDSGLSVDSIVEVKIMFDKLLQTASKLGVVLYIVVSANEYELARGMSCFDVNSGKYITFKDYEDYRAFIIKTRKNKEKRIEKQAVWLDKKHKREEEQYNRLVEKCNAKIQKIKDSAVGRNLTFAEKYSIEGLERQIRDEKPNWMR